MDIKEKRKAIRIASKSARERQVNDKSVDSATRLCSVCLRPLCGINRLGKPYVTVAHIEYKLGDILKAYVCKDIRSCRAHKEQISKEGTDGD